MHVVPHTNAASGGGNSHLSLCRYVKRLNSELVLVDVVVLLKDVIQVPHFDAAVHRGGDH